MLNVYLVLVVYLSFVTSQPLSCGKLNPLVGTAVNVFESRTGFTAGELSVANDCAVELKKYNITSLAPVRLRRRNSITKVLEEVFIDSIVTIADPFSQLFFLRAGLSFGDGDQFIFISESVTIASALLVLPIKTTTTTRATTTTIRATTAAAAITTAVASSSPTIPGSSTTRKVYNPGKLVFVTLGSNANYPNPPTTQEVSLYINNVESPVLTLVRGNDYTFSIMTSARHPFYLTTSIEGGKKIFPDSEETIFLGNSSTWGTLEAPMLLPFKPTEEMPNEFYYQCWNHTRMGWKVILINPGQLAQPTIPPLVTDSPGERVSAAFWLTIVMVFVLGSL